ncbi:MAG TPA: sigma-54 dependent transcriptional regulator [Candidatus Sulfotelmatobacter sp.]|nr:sigma-54 dependent transcriptional regulator [Candidatus Sulfotelmatobacter sp.]
MTRNDSRIRLLVVDDEQSIRRLCMTVGSSLDYICTEAESAEAALSQSPAIPPDIVIADLRLPNLSGADLLRQLKTRLPATEVVIMTGHGSIESAVEAMKLGAYDYIQKPFRVEELRMLLRRMEEKIRLVQENRVLRERVETDQELDGIIGESAKIREILRMISRLKDTWTPVLICGESGTGKELVARAIHYRGTFAKRPFVAVDCGALVPTLMESDLFGYAKGAFTGASKSKIGLFQAADGGTIFLDEIGELPPELQAKLLRVLQEKEVRPVGSNENIHVQVRVVAATNRDLETAIREGGFRKDLFFRLNVVSINLPPLRERRSDIPMLSQYFLDRLAEGANMKFTPAAMKLLMRYDWPGNVRELENSISRAVTLGDRKVIDDSDLSPAMLRSSSSKEKSDPVAAESPSEFDDSTVALDELERQTIQRVFDKVGGDKAKAGELLGISRATLYRKLKRYQISATRRDDKILA